MDDPSELLRNEFWTFFWMVQRSSSEESSKPPQNYFERVFWRLCHSCPNRYRGVLWSTSEDSLRTSEDLSIFSKCSKVLQNMFGSVLWRQFWRHLESCPSDTEEFLRSPSERLQKTWDFPSQDDQVSFERVLKYSENTESPLKRFRSTSETPLRKLHVLMLHPVSPHVKKNIKKKHNAFWASKGSL